MLLCSLLLFFSAPLFPSRPAGQPDLIDLLPGLTFIDGRFWGLVLGIPPPVLEGAYWSLYVEVKIYLLFGFLYYQSGSKKAITAITLCFFGSTVLLPVLPLPPGLQIPLTLAAKMLSAEHYGWFAAGALLYRYSRKGQIPELMTALLTGIVAAIYVKETGAGPKLAALAIVTLFFAAVLIPRVHAPLSHPLLLGAGFISYPLFLLHENIAVSLIVQLGDAAPWVTPILLPVLPIGITVVLAWLLARYGEPVLQTCLKGRMTWISKVFQGQ